MAKCVHIMLGWLAECQWPVMFTTIIGQTFSFQIIVQATGQYSLANYSEDCIIISAIGAQLNILFHPLVIHMMKTRLDS